MCIVKKYDVFTSRALEDTWSPFLYIMFHTYLIHK